MQIELKVKNIISTNNIKSFWRSQIETAAAICFANRIEMLCWSWNALFKCTHKFLGLKVLPGLPPTSFLLKATFPHMAFLKKFFTFFAPKMTFFRKIFGTPVIFLQIWSKIFKIILTSPPLKFSLTRVPSSLNFWAGSFRVLCSNAFPVPIYKFQNVTVRRCWLISVTWKRWIWCRCRSGCRSGGSCWRTWGRVRAGFPQRPEWTWRPTAKPRGSNKDRTSGCSAAACSAEIKVRKRFKNGRLAIWSVFLS